MEKILKTLGNIIIVLIILACLPLAVPKLFGLQEFNVISGSMEPEISVGSIVYVKPVAFEELAEGDIIAFEAGATVVTHRIESLNTSDLLITTKGDANASADFMPVAFTNVIGKVILHLPFIGVVAAWLSETLGKIVAGILLIVGVLLSNVGEKKDKSVSSDDTSKKQSKKSGINPKIILALGLVIVFGSLGGFLYIYMGYQKSENLYDSLQQQYTTSKSADSGAKEVPWYEMVDVDIEALKQLNSDVAGWIYLENTDISYPILYSGDDDTYLRTTIDKEYATAGSIFLEGYNLPDWTDSHDIIYGHNMRNLSMFGKLRFYKSEEDYYDSHQYFQIITADGRMRFEIFSYFDTEPGSWVYTVPYSVSPEFDEYIADLVSHSYRKLDCADGVNSSDKVVTLSTCSASGMRFTVHGYLCDTWGK